MKTFRLRNSIGVAALLASFLLVGNAAAAGTTWWVANDGLDSGACGARATPCRSISQAIENASDGDTIEVGAGHYGNVSGRGDLTGPGDEHPQMSGDDFFPGCIVCITKALHIFSLHGAAVTIVDAPASTPYTTTVLILHDGVLFGRPGNGFTLTGGNQNGLVLDQNGAPGDAFGFIRSQNIIVSGNIDEGDTNGFVFTGLEVSDLHCPVPSCEPTAQLVFSGNEAFHNSVGFNFVTGEYFGPPITLSGNLASGSATCFLVNPGFQSETLSGSEAGTILESNIASRCGIGFDADAPGNMTRNSAVDNSVAGFKVVPGFGVFNGNSALGNGGPGVIVQFSVDDQDFLTRNTFAAFSGNNFFGNDRNRPPLALKASGTRPVPPFDPGPGAHCGVLNVGALASFGTEDFPFVPLPQPLQAANNFWGSAKGPQPTGVGDMAGGPCDQNHGVTGFKPFAAADFAITN